MKNHFLFDSDDKKQCGTRCDVLRTEGDNLVLDWRWGVPHYKENSQYKKIPSQVSSAKIGNFTCKAIFWYDEYEAEIEHIDDTLISYCVRQEEGDYLKTRVDAQKKAEELLMKFYLDMGILLKEKFVKKRK